MAGALTLANAMQNFDPMGAVQQGQTLAANQMQLQDTNQMRSLRQQAVEAPGGYNPESHKELLMKAGFFEEAQDLDDLMHQGVQNKQQALERGLNIMEKTGQLVTKVGAPAWPMFRGSLIAAGLADEQMLPAEYNEQAAQIAQNFTQQSSDVFRILRFRSGNQQQDVLNMGGKITMGKPYSPGTQTALEKNTQFLADTMGIDPQDAAQIMIQSKDKSDAAVYQDLYKTALRATYGDQAEAARMAKEGLSQVRAVRQETSPQKPQMPVQRPGAEPRAQQFEVGKTYVDSQGNKAKYLGPDQWEPVQ